MQSFRIHPPLSLSCYCELTPTDILCLQADVQGLAIDSFAFNTAAKPYIPVADLNASARDQPAAPHASCAQSEAKVGSL